MVMLREEVGGGGGGGGGMVWGKGALIPFDQIFQNTLYVQKYFIWWH